MTLPPSMQFLTPGWWAVHVGAAVALVGAGILAGHLHGAEGGHEAHGAAATGHDAHAAAPAADRAAHGAAKGEAAATDHAAHGAPAPADHGAHGGADHHSSPEALRPVMHAMLVDLAKLQVAIGAGDAPTAATAAQNIAAACEAEPVTTPDPAVFGPRFAEIDAALHGAAADIATAAKGGDLAKARAGYATVVDHCQGCHTQAPTGGKAQLGKLAEAP